MNSKTITIVGSGITGLALAWKLSKKGFRVTVLEKQEFIGGVSYKYSF